MRRDYTARFRRELPQRIPNEVLEEWTRLTTQRIWQLAKEGIIPKADRGLFPFEATMKGILAYYRERAENIRTTAGSKNRKLEAEAKIKENQVLRDMGELVPILELANQMNRPLAAMRQLILTCSMDAEEKDELMVNLQELYGSIFGDKIKSLKVKDFIRKHKIYINHASDKSNSGR